MEKKFTKEDYSMAGYNTPLFNQRFDMKTLENSEYKINEDRFFESIAKMLDINSQVVRIKRGGFENKNKFTVFTSGNLPILELIYKKIDHILDIVSMTDKSKKISLRTTYNEKNNPKDNDTEQIIFNHYFDLFVNQWINLPTFYSTAVSKIMSQPIDENDIELLNDSNFRKMLDELKDNDDN